MDVIVVMLDSFRQDHVGAYHGGKEVFPGIEPCRTPNLDRSAPEANFRRGRSARVKGVQETYEMGSASVE